MNVLCIGDIVGTPGCEMAAAQIKFLREEYQADFVIANGENAATGNGVTRKKADMLLDCGIDVLTTGNHVFTKKEINQLFAEGYPILRPVNYPKGTPGNGYVIKTAPNGVRIGVINAIGRVFMNPVDSPFEAVKECVEELRDKTGLIFVDFHAEATSETAALAW